MEKRTRIAKRICAILMAVTMLGTAINIPWESKADGADMPSTSHAENGMGRITSVEKNSEELKLHTTTSGKNIVLSLSFLKDGGIRLCAEDTKAREVKNALFEPSVTGINVLSDSNKVLTVEGTEGSTKIVLDYSNDKWTIAVCKKGSSEEVYKLWSDQLTTSYTGNERKTVSFRGDINTTAKEQFVGLGEQYSGLILNGKTYNLWNTDNHSVDSYANVPLLHSSKGYSVFFNSYYGAKADIGATYANSFVFDFAGPDMDLYVWTGTLLENVKSYTKLTGTSAAIPKWAVGYWAGGTDYHYWQQWAYTGKAESDTTKQQEVLSNMLKKYESLGTIPSAVYVEGQLSRQEEAYNLCGDYGVKMLGWHHPDQPWASANQKYDDTYTSNLMQYVTGTNEAPVVHKKSNTSEKFYEDGYGASNQTKTMRVDYTNAYADRFVWATLWNYCLNLNLSGLMTDYADTMPVETAFSNGLYGDEMHQLQPYYYYKSMKKLFEEDAQKSGDYILFVRAGCAGSQQFAAMTGGDQDSTFGASGDRSGLRQAISGALSSGTAGFAVWGSDISGHGSCEDKELYQRWLEFGTFSPLMRSHGQKGVDPWDYNDEKVTATFQKYYWLRENLTDTIYSSSLKAHIDGTPIMQPMALAYPEELFSIEDQYLFCDEIMVCPVYEQGKTSRTVTLPKGVWYDLLSGEAVCSDGSSQTVSAPVDKIPAYIKGQSVMPVKVSSNTWTLTEEMNDNSGTQALLVTPGENGKTRTLEWYVSETEKSTYTSSTKDNLYIITAKQDSNPNAIVAYGMNAEQVSVDGVKLNQLFQQPDGTQAGYYSDGTDKLVIVLPSSDWKEIRIETPKTWDYGFDLTYRCQPTEFLDKSFEVYAFGNPSTTENAKAGEAFKPSVTEPTNGYGYSYYTTEPHGANSRGYLKPASVKTGGYTVLTYKNSSYKDFEAEYEIFTSWSIFGLSFGGARGEFPVSLDGNATNDPGVMLWLENEGNLNIGGAIKPETASCTSASVNVTGTQSGLKQTNNIRTSSLTGKAIDPGVANPDNNSPTYTICVKVMNGTLTVWEKENPDKKVSVQLMEQYQGGYVSLIANQTQHGAFKSFHIRAMEQELYYSTNFETLSDVSELDNTFTAYHFNKIGDKISFSYDVNEPDKIDGDALKLNDIFDSYYFASETAVSEKGLPTAQWFTDPNTSVPGTYEGQWRNWALKPRHTNSNSQMTLLTLKEDLDKNFNAEVTYVTNYCNYGIMVAPEGERSNEQNGFRVDVSSNGQIRINGEIDGKSAVWNGANAEQMQTGKGFVTGPAQQGYKGPEPYNSASYALVVSVQDGKLKAAVKDSTGNALGGTLTVDLLEDYVGGKLSLWSTGYNQGGFRKFTAEGERGSEAGRPSQYWNRELTQNGQMGTDKQYLKPNHLKGTGSISFLTYKKTNVSDFKEKVKIANSWVEHGVAVVPAGEMFGNDNGIALYVSSDGTIRIYGAIDVNSAVTTNNWKLEKNKEEWGIKGVWTGSQSMTSPSYKDSEKTVYTLCVNHENGLLTAYLEEHPENKVSVRTTASYQGGAIALFSTGHNQGGFKSLEFDTYTEDTIMWERGRSDDYVTYTLRTDFAYDHIAAIAAYDTNAYEYKKAITSDGISVDVRDDNNGNLELYLNSTGGKKHMGNWITLSFELKDGGDKKAGLTPQTVRIATTKGSSRKTDIKQTFPGDVNDDYDVNVKDLVRLKKYMADKGVFIHKENSQLNINTKIEDSYNQKLLRKKLVQ